MNVPNANSSQNDLEATQTGKWIAKVQPTANPSPEADLSTSTTVLSRGEADSARTELKFHDMSRKARRHVMPDQDNPWDISRVRRSLTGRSPDSRSGSKDSTVSSSSLDDLCHPSGELKLRESLA